MIRIGTAGWSIPRSATALAPGDGSHLERYGRALSCAEINSSFYRPPMASTWCKWAAAVPCGFRFSVKAPKAITHEAQLRCPPEVLQSFCEAAALLGDRLGPLLFQLPPKLAFDEAIAQKFFIGLRAGYDGSVALEARHSSWFTAPVSQLLVEHRIARVAADPARVPEAAEPAGWRGFTYYRLHGSPRTYYSAYTPEYLDRLANLAAEEGKTSDVWVIFDNTASGAALNNAFELRDRLRLAGSID
jgi:uncharacterized protein YecE (DUF72 family)